MGNILKTKGSSSPQTNSSQPSENTSSGLNSKDEDVAWKERCEVVTNLDHQENVIAAREVLTEIVGRLPVDSPVEYSLTHNDNRSFSSLSESSFDSAKEFLQQSSSREAKEGDTTDFESADEDITPNHSLNALLIPYTADTVVKDSEHLLIPPLPLENDCTLFDTTLVATPRQSVELIDCHNQSPFTANDSLQESQNADESSNVKDELGLSLNITVSLSNDTDVEGTDLCTDNDLVSQDIKAKASPSELALDIDDCIAFLSGLTLNDKGTTAVVEACDSCIQTSEVGNHCQPSEFHSISETSNQEVITISSLPVAPDDFPPQTDSSIDGVLPDQISYVAEEPKLCVDENSSVPGFLGETSFPDLLETSTPNKECIVDCDVTRPLQSSPVLDKKVNADELAESLDSRNCVEDLDLAIELPPEASQDAREQELTKYEKEFEELALNGALPSYSDALTEKSVHDACNDGQSVPPDVLNEATSCSSDLSRLAESWSIISSEEAETSVNSSGITCAVVSSDSASCKLEHSNHPDLEAVNPENNSLAPEIVIAPESNFDTESSSNSAAVERNETSVLATKSEESNSRESTNFDDKEQVIDIKSSCDTDLDGKSGVGIVEENVQSQNCVPEEENEKPILILNKSIYLYEDITPLGQSVTSTDIVSGDCNLSAGSSFEKPPDILNSENLCNNDGGLAKESPLDDTVKPDVFVETRESCLHQDKTHTEVEGVIFQETATDPLCTVEPEEFSPSVTPSALDISGLLPANLDVEKALQAEAYQVIELLNLSQANPDLFGNSVLMPTSGIQSSNQMADNANTECASPGPEPNCALELDDNVNPFQTKSKLGHSPDKNQSLDNSLRDAEYCTDNGKNLKYDPGQHIVSSKISKGKVPIPKTSPKRKPAVQGLADEKSSPSAQDTLSDKRCDESCIEHNEISGEDKKDKSEMQKVVNGSACDSSAVSQDVFKIPSLPSKGDCRAVPVSTSDVPAPSLLESSMSEDSGIDDLHPNKSKTDSSPLSKLTPDDTSDSQHYQTAESKAAVNFSEAGPDVAECKQEEFKSATDFFMDPKSLDILENYHGGKINESTLARMSLYVKFDPLVPGHSQVSRWLAKCPAPDKPESECEDRKENVQDNSSNSSPKGQSLNASGTDGQGLIDLWNSPLKVKSEAASTAPDIVEEHMPQSNSSKLIPDEEARRMLTIQELLFQDRLLMKDREWDEKLKQLEKENKQLQSQVQSLREARQEMRQVVLEYEKTMSQVIADTDKDKQALSATLTQVTKERDQALEDLQHVESAFADLYRRYEKTKTAVEGFKKNEEILTNCVAEYQATIKKQADMYEVLKSRAEEKLESASLEIENVRKASESEIAALRAQLKKAEMKIETLDKSLEQKAKENLELTNICDELIAQVGHSS